MNVSDVKEDNLAKADRLVAQAAGNGAELVVLPEMWNAIGEPEVLRTSAEPLDRGPTVELMRTWARRHGIAVVGGSICLLGENGDRLSNACLVFDREGELAAVYRKIHMFDVDVGGFVYRESDVQEPGDEPVVCELEDWRLGLTICYDLRFPELHRVLALEGADVLTVPAAFTLYTGKDHWAVLLRARAVENQCFVAAAAQWGVHPPGRPSYGRSMIVDPWGLVLAQAPDEDTVIAAELDRSAMEEIRRRLPALASRRPAAYRWPAQLER
jgi:deaminated glutathione amidase